METNESSLVIEGGSEIVSGVEGIERQVAVESDSPAWLKELSSFATALVVTAAAVVLGGVVALLFCYAFFITTPVALLALVVATARNAYRQRELVS